MEEKTKENIYYNGNKLLNMKDLDGVLADVLICTSNRTAGKTTFFNKFVIDNALQNDEEFLLIYRYKNELENVSEKFFGNVGNLFFKDYEISTKGVANYTYVEIYLNDKIVGYATSLTNATKIKKYSHVFSKVKYIVFDEFQDEDNKYLKNEVSKLLSIHTSVARGDGEMVRTVRIILISNPISIINPYYIALGISDRLKSDTKFLRGNGWILEQGHNEIAEKMQNESRVNKAFSNDKYTKYSSQGIYLNDNYSLIQNVSGKSKYLCTLIYNKKLFAIRQYYDSSILYCDKKVDNNCKIKIAVTTDDLSINYVSIKHYSFIVEYLKLMFEKGCFRFKDLECKEVIFKLLSVI